MLIRIAIMAMLAGSVCVGAQTPADDHNPASSSAAASSGTASPGSSEPAKFKSNFGFSYTYPSDWEVVDSKPMLPAIQLKAGETASSDAERHAIDCTQLALMIRHGTPKSVILVVVLPFECAGVHIKQSDLASVASGVSTGLKKGFEIHDPIYGAYKLGTHDFWAERSHAISKNHPELEVTLETVCSIAKDSLVCWMNLARDDEAIKVFESGLASVEDDLPAALVPASAFKQVEVLKPEKK